MPIRSIFIIVIFILTNSAIAQDSEPDVWHWAWDRSEGELFAYSQNGETHLLLTNVTGWIENVWRISSDEAVGLIEISDQPSLYWLNNETAELIRLDFEQEQFGMCQGF